MRQGGVSTARCHAQLVDIFRVAVRFLHRSRQGFAHGAANARTSTRFAASFSGASAVRPPIHLPSAIIRTALTFLFPIQAGDARGLLALPQPGRHVARFAGQLFHLPPLCQQQRRHVFRHGTIHIFQFLL